jgi:uridine phosphorylase
MEPFKPDHVAITPEDVASPQPGGRFFFLPGSFGRARAIAESFTDVRTFSSSRGYDVHTGRLTRGGRTIDAGVVATGMGCPSVDCVVTELIALGLRSFLRIGSAGSVAPARVKAGHVVIASAAVRDENASLAYAPPEFPALASLAILDAARRAAGSIAAAGVVHTGVVLTKDSMFGREFGFGPRGAANLEYGKWMARLGVLASEMEAAHLFILAQVYSAWPVLPEGTPGAPPLLPLHAGCILAVIGDEHNGLCDAATMDATTTRAVDLGLATAVEFVEQQW